MNWQSKKELMSFGFVKHREQVSQKSLAILLFACFLFFFFFVIYVCLFSIHSCLSIMFFIHSCLSFMFWFIHSCLFFSIYFYLNWVEWSCNNLLIPNEIFSSKISLFDFEREDNKPIVLINCSLPILLNSKRFFFF